MRVCVIGTGYVGLVTGVCLAKIGHDVICIDNNEAKVKIMQSGESPIFEPGLSELMAEAIVSGKIQFSTDLGMGVKHGEILFIAVGTPPLPNGSSDTRFVEAVAKGIGEHLNGDYKVIVNKSTVPIGSGDWVKMLVMDGIAQRHKQPSLTISKGETTPTAPLTISKGEATPTAPLTSAPLTSAPLSERSRSENIRFDVVSNPEFLREGSAVYDTFNPDRIVLGGSNREAIELMQKLYAPIVNREYAEDKNQLPVPILTTDLGSAEMIKYAANAFLATKISFINEVANICDRVGADITQVAKGIGLDSRIGGKFLNAGIGWGGSCFPKDVSALVTTAEDYGYNAQLLKATVEVNQRQRLIVIDKLQHVLKILKGKTIGLLGLTFKPDTDDMRDAPALDLIRELNRLGAKVKAYDPLISKQSEMTIDGVSIEPNLNSLADGCDVLVLITEWEEFKHIPYHQIGKLMKEKIIIDGRNFLDAELLKSLDFQYIGMGR
jgi:UDPglucose 6-dehydrogenase